MRTVANDIAVGDIIMDVAPKSPKSTVYLVDGGEVVTAVTHFTASGANFIRIELGPNKVLNLTPFRAVTLR